MRADEPGEVFGHMVRLVRRISQAGAAELQRHELSPAQFQLLALLHREPGMAQHELAEAFGVTKGNVSQLVKKLELSGLVRRVRVQSTDELALTPAGTALVERLIPDQARFLAEQLSALDSVQLAQLRDLLGKLDP